MNKLEMSSYCEPDFNIYYDEFINEENNEKISLEEGKIAEEKTREKYANFTDDDWRALGDNY